jgi:hypothetical protein
MFLKQDRRGSFRALDHNMTLDGRAAAGNRPVKKKRFLDILIVFKNI